VASKTRGRVNFGKGGVRKFVKRYNASQNLWEQRRKWGYKWTVSSGEKARGVNGIHE